MIKGNDKKIGIVSCYFQENYGSMLQALATERILKKLEIEYETVCVDGFMKEINKKKSLYFIKASLTSDFFIYKVGKILNKLRLKLINNEYAKDSRTRHLAFQDFKSKSFILSKKTNSLNDFGQLCKEQYSSVIVGSDQLWLPGNIAADYYTLGMVPDGINKIAYATSFGQATLPKNIVEKANSFLTRIDHISVREETGKNIVETISGRKVPVVCDPTLLFSGDEWLQIQKKEPVAEGSYIFCYFLGNNPKHREFVTRLREHTKCRVISLIHLPEYKRCDVGYADETPFDVDPADFVNLIRNAKYICTDSFHCCVFSIIYEKCFFAFRRFTKDTEISTNSRLDTLFNTLMIRDRILSGDEDIKDCLKLKIDYSSVKDNLERWREYSLQYLTKSIHNEEDTDL